MPECYRLIAAAPGYLLAGKWTWLAAQASSGSPVSFW
jgi:hypothetical protein